MIQVWFGGDITTLYSLLIFIFGYICSKGLGWAPQLEAKLQGAKSIEPQIN